MRPVDSPVPIFLLSQPRSGSTFVQRVLAGHDAVATASEPWILVAPLLALHPGMPYNAGWHDYAAVGTADFAVGLPHGPDSYRAATADFARRLYAERAGLGPRYFLDKTPGYHWVAQDICASFPEAKIILLWRNPLAVVASHVDTFREGRWEMHQHAGDLFNGITNLVRAYERYNDRILSVRYEDLFDGTAAWQQVFDHLDLEFSDSLLERFTGVDLSGRLGDVTGRARYGAPSRQPLDKWKETVSTPIRRAWCRRYLRWVGRERLAIMGYDLDTLLAELDEVEVGLRGMGSDVAVLTRAAGWEATRTRILRARGRPMFPSTIRLLLSSG